LLGNGYFHWYFLRDYGHKLSPIEILSNRMFGSTRVIKG
jgi:hypothetical protein